ncbi:hypothetical protein THOM_3205 [Trachipleistophora hominis]|uniref:Uncharacterized protein n=1 Tax=Trachipleistophora hominis TaxID=72359 RepID=L7JQY9_TRAHO|nr:hypothetical protein THOM_3205 [Trachipleistophora hominis]
MIKEKLQKLQSLKKTSDLYTKPLFLLQNTEHLDIDTHRDMLCTDKYIKRNQLRETYTEQQEKKFNRKYSEYLKALVKKRADDCFGVLIDFHIKFYRIDRYNRNELIFVLLPDYQIYERELGMLGVEPSWCGIIREMTNRQFYYLVMEYHRYDELFFKRLMYSFLESNEKLPSFYGLAALRAAKKMKDPVFLRYVYLSFKRKAGIEVKELETAVLHDAIEMDEEKVLKGCDGQHEYISVQDVNRKQDDILVQCRDAVTETNQ